MLNYCCSKSSGILHSLLPLRLPLSESLQELFLRLQPQADYACPFCCFMSFLSHLWHPQDRNGECNKHYFSTNVRICRQQNSKWWAPSTIPESSPVQSRKWNSIWLKTPWTMPQTSPFPDTGHLLGYTADSFLLLDAFKHYCSLVFLPPLHRFLGSSISSIYCFASWDPVLHHFW